MIPEPKEKIFHLPSGAKIEVELFFENEDNDCGYASSCHLYLSGDDRTQDASSSLEFAKHHEGLEGCDDQEIVRLPMCVIDRIEEWAKENGY
jgi:hypothetical protein|tara:strand:+ start:2034 stop:2309 length:276 start_codon:yes stop_codon:yes gene_type:complete